MRLLMPVEEPLVPYIESGDAVMSRCTAASCGIIIYTLVIFEGRGFASIRETRKIHGCAWLYIYIIAWGGV